MSKHTKPTAALGLSLAMAAAACGGDRSDRQMVQSAAPAAKAKAAAKNAGPLLKSTRHDGTPVPNPGVRLERGSTALVVTDPQIDFLDPKGVTWGVVGKSVTANNTVAHLDQLFAAARSAGVPAFVSPHYYYPTDHEWEFGGAVEKMMHGIGMFDRAGPLNLDDFDGSGADWLASLAPHIEHASTVVTSPHKVYGPETNDLVLQLRKRGIDKVILAGMSANLCVESHMRELLEQGFEVVVVGDATAAAQTPVGDGYASAMTNFRYMANALVNTAEATRALKALEK